MTHLKLSFEPYILQLKHPFTVATQSRKQTPGMLVKLEYKGVTGYGEASMPPYLGETQESVANFLSKAELSRFSQPYPLEDIIQYVDELEPGNNAAKASIDIALHDLIGKQRGLPWYEIWEYNPATAPETSFTIGIDTPEMMKQKVLEASGFNILKIKLGKENDKELIEAVKSVTDKTLYADVNQGWTDKYFALDMTYWLKDQGVLFVEQPLPKEQIKDIAWLTERSPIFIMADEGIKRLDDLIHYSGAYSGVNIKLMKSTGMHEAHLMAGYARKCGMKVMIGCMTETSCAVSAAAQLSPICDYADLDGPFLIANNPFEDMVIKNGKLKIPTAPGIGAIKKTSFSFRSQR